MFRYPGVRSDSDMYTLGYSFRPWEGEQAIADGASILQYIKDTATESGIDERIRFHHRIVAAAWSTEDSRWTVTAKRTDTGAVVTLTCGFVFSCTGYYRYDKGYLPDFAGMDRFRGMTVHPQSWPADLDHAGKRVVVIGSGATAVTLVPALAATAEHVTMLQRSPSYIVALPARNPVARAVQRALPKRYADPAVRWFLALATQGFFQLSRRRPQFVKRLLRKGLQRELPATYDIDTHFTPSYEPWDQRLCLAPDGDLFQAIRAGTASVITDRIAAFAENGVLLESGRQLDADIIVTATGLELLFIGGVRLSVDGADVDLPRRLTYKGVMLEGVPNFAVAVGYANASWTLKSDLACGYVCRLLNHMRATGHRQCVATNSDPSIGSGSLLGLSSGYVQRSADRFPRQGHAFPWQFHQSYLRDYRMLKRRGVTDRALEFSSPLETPATASVALAGE